MAKTFLREGVVAGTADDDGIVIADQASSEVTISDAPGGVWLSWWSRLRGFAMLAHLVGTNMTAATLVESEQLPSLAAVPGGGVRMANGATRVVTRSADDVATPRSRAARH